MSAMLSERNRKRFTELSRQHVRLECADLPVSQLPAELYQLAKREGISCTKADAALIAGTLVGEDINWQD